MGNPVKSSIAASHAIATVSAERWLLGLIVALALAVVLFASGKTYLRTLQATDLSGDQGIFAEMTRVFVRGGLLYQGIYDNKPPGLFFILAPFVAALGNTAPAIKAGTVFINLVFTAAVTALVYRLTGSKAAGIAALAMALLYSAQRQTPETTFTAATLGVCAMASATIARGRTFGLLAGGFLFAWGMLSKQPLILELPILLALAAWGAPRRRLRAVIITLAGIMLALAGFAIWFASLGILDDFWFYTFTMTVRYVLSSSGSWHFDDEAAGYFRIFFLGDSLPRLLPLLAAAAVSGAVIARSRDYRPLIWIITAWIAAGFVGALVGRSFRWDYFQQPLPALIVLTALAAPLYSRMRVRWQVVVAVLSLALVYSFSTEPLRAWRGLRQRADPQQGAVGYIVEHTGAEDCIWTWGVVANLNYLADRRACQSAVQEGFVMDPAAFPARPNRVGYMRELLDSSPALLIVESEWEFFPELQKYADRYVGGLVYADEQSEIYAVNRSTWHPADARFGDFIALAGYDLPKQAAFCPGDAIPMSLTWQQLETPPQQYQMFVQLLTADEQTQIAQHDDMPAQERPTNTWVDSGEYILGETFTLHIPDTAAPGTYRLIAGLYEVESLQRLDVFDDEGQSAGTYAHLQQVTVEECAGN